MALSRSSNRYMNSIPVIPLGANCITERTGCGPLLQHHGGRSHGAELAFWQDRISHQSRRLRRDTCRFSLRSPSLSSGDADLPIGSGRGEPASDLWGRAKKTVRLRYTPVDQRRPTSSPPESHPAVDAGSRHQHRPVWTCPDALPSGRIPAPGVFETFPAPP